MELKDPQSLSPKALSRGVEALTSSEIPRHTEHLDLIKPHREEIPPLSNFKDIPAFETRTVTS